MRQQGYSLKSIQAYRKWVMLYVRFHYLTHPLRLKEHHVRLFLIHLSMMQKCRWYEIDQCTSALLFLYRRVLNQPDFVVHQPGHPSHAPNPALLDMDE